MTFRYSYDRKQLRRMLRCRTTEMQQLLIVGGPNKYRFVEPNAVMKIRNKKEQAWLEKIAILSAEEIPNVPI